MEIKNFSKDHAEIIIPEHKRTITLTEELVQRYKLSTDKLFVEFPRLKLYISLCDYYDGPDFILECDENIFVKIISPTTQFKKLVFLTKDISICLGKKYPYPLTEMKIKEMINRFFNSKFNNEIMLFNQIKEIECYL